MISPRLFLWCSMLLLLPALACSASGAAKVSLSTRAAPTASSTVPATEVALHLTPTLVHRVVCSDGLHVRTQPDPSAPVLDILPRGSVVDVLGRSRGWVSVGVGQWVRESYLC